MSVLCFFLCRGGVGLCLRHEKSPLGLLQFTPGTFPVAHGPLRLVSDRHLAGLEGAKPWAEMSRGLLTSTRPS